MIGLTDHGQSHIGDIIYLEIAPAGTIVRQGDRCGSIESGKWVGNLLAPISGVIVETNREAEADPHQRQCRSLRPRLAVPDGSRPTETRSPG